MLPFFRPKAMCLTGWVYGINLLYSPQKQQQQQNPPKNPKKPYQMFVKISCSCLGQKI